MTRLIEFLRDLKKKPKKQRQQISYLIIAIGTPAVILLWLLLFLGTLQQISLDSTNLVTRETLGPRAIRFVKEFMGNVVQGFGNLFAWARTQVQEFYLDQKFESLWYKIQGRPEPRKTEQESPVPLPVEVE